MEKLLQKINSLLQEERILKQEKDKRGENFNVFEIMHAQYDEVYTHSAVIAALLNPKGKHGCNTTFLKLFMERLVEEHKESPATIVSLSNLSSCNVQVEYSIGPVEANYEYGGRLDLVIETATHDKAIIIENKIYASDQPKQLYRYKSYAERKYKSGNFSIVYLTLDGHSPSEDSIKGDRYEMVKDHDFICASYSSFILDWLAACKEKAASIPTVRETITQYHKLISKLTHQDMETSTKEKLLEQLATKDNITAVFRIHNIFGDVLNQVCNTELINQIKEIAEELDLQYACSHKNWCKRWEGQFFFYKPEWKSFYIGFEFMSDNLRNFCFGIRYKPEAKGTASDIKNQISTVLKNGSANDWWASFKQFKYPNWDNEGVFNKLYNGKIKEEIKSDITDLLKKLELEGIEL